jgi:hypothetical protein
MQNVTAMRGLADAGFRESSISESPTGVTPWSSAVLIYKPNSPALPRAINAGNVAMPAFSSHAKCYYWHTDMRKIHQCPA